jgi:hypothetical protein
MKQHFAFTRTGFRLAIIVLLIALSVDVNGQKERIQTAFIYQMTQLIEWCPDGKEGNFVIGIIGDVPDLYQEMIGLNNRRVGTQQIEVSPIRDISEISRTNILIVPDEQFDNINEIASHVSDFCTLIISDRRGSATRGAGIAMVYDERQSGILLDINQRYMRTNSLTVNRRLLDLATNLY